MRDRGLFAWLTIVVAIGIAGFSIVAQEPPRAVPGDAPLEVFSEARARKHVEVIAKEAHPMNSVANDRAREFVVARLREMGLDPKIQKPRTRDHNGTNVVARLKGAGPPGKKALLLCAHYDSVAGGPGAGDDASGVSVILETLRALKAGPTLDRDVIVLIDDGEEQGLFGAKLFVDEHPWAREVGVVLNFDARGNHGPSFMFETSEQNGWLIRQVARALPHPLATSMSMDIYRIMPNDTNLTVFKQAGMAGLNFAFSRGLAIYHSPEDTPSNLDPRTLQHHGENALAMTRHLARLDLDDPREDDVVYFSILNRWVIYYPTSWAMPLTLPLAFVFMAGGAIGQFSRRIKGLDLIVGVLAWPVLAVVSIFASGGFWLILRDMTSSFGIPWVRFDLLVLCACAIVSGSTCLGLWRWIGRSVEGMALGALWWWVVLAVVTARYLPGMSYLFTWPSLFALLGLILAMVTKPRAYRGLVAAFLGSIPTLMILPPLSREAFEGLSLRLAAPLMIMVALTLGALLPILGPIVGSKRTP